MTFSRSASVTRTAARYFQADVSNPAPQARAAPTARKTPSLGAVIPPVLDRHAIAGVHIGGEQQQRAQSAKRNDPIDPSEQPHVIKIEFGDHAPDQPEPDDSVDRGFVDKSASNEKHGVAGHQDRNGRALR